MVKSDTLPVKSLTDLKIFILQGIGAIVIWWGGYETVCSLWLKNHLFQQTAAWSAIRNLPCYYVTPKYSYNYAIRLWQIDNFKASNQVLTNILHYINNYDIQLMLGENYMAQGLYREALAAFQLANDMCPNRFYPLYYSFEIYKIIDPLRAREMAERLIRKVIKVDSYDVRRMKIKARMYLMTE